MAQTEQPIIQPLIKYFSVGAITMHGGTVKMIMTEEKKDSFVADWHHIKATKQDQKSFTYYAVKHDEQHFQSGTQVVFFFVDVVALEVVPL